MHSIARIIPLDCYVYSTAIVNKMSFFSEFPCTNRLKADMDDTLDDIHMHRSEDSHDMDDIPMHRSKDSHEGPKKRKLSIEDLRQAYAFTSGLLPPRVFVKVGTSQIYAGTS